MVSNITDNSTMIGNVQKIDIEETIAKESGVERFQKFLGLIEFSLARMSFVSPRICLNSACQQSQAVAGKILHKRMTRNSPKLMALPSTASSSDSATKNNPASSVPSDNDSKSKHVNNATKPSTKKYFKRLSRSKSKKIKG